MLIGLLIIGFLMIILSVWFTYMELKPFLAAFKAEVDATRGALDSMTFTFRVVRHLPMLIPSAVDVMCLVFLSTFLGFGGGIMGGVTGVFASNCISAVIYYHTHVRKTKPAIN